MDIQGFPGHQDFRVIIPAHREFQGFLESQDSAGQAGLWGSVAKVVFQGSVDPGRQELVVSQGSLEPAASLVVREPMELLGLQGHRERAGSQALRDFQGLVEIRVYSVPADFRVRPGQVGLPGFRGFLVHPGLAVRRAFREPLGLAVLQDSLVQVDSPVLLAQAVFQQPQAAPALAEPLGHQG